MPIYDPDKIKFDDGLKTISDLSTTINSQKRLMECLMKENDRIAEKNERLRHDLNEIWQRQALWEHSVGYRPVNG
jgi:FtsZ-binding cell division protein ZapB